MVDEMDRISYILRVLAVIFKLDTTIFNNWSHKLIVN